MALLDEHAAQVLAEEAGRAGDEDGGLHALRLVVADSAVSPRAARYSAIGVVPASPSVHACVARREPADHALDVIRDRAVLLAARAARRRASATSSYVRYGPTYDATRSPRFGR